jgi:hypothetical protein
MERVKLQAQAVHTAVAVWTAWRLHRVERGRRDQP